MIRAHTEIAEETDRRDEQRIPPEAEAHDV
jgi:hypothetical protein